MTMEIDKKLFNDYIIVAGSSSDPTIYLTLDVSRRQDLDIGIGMIDELAELLKLDLRREGFYHITLDMEWVIDSVDGVSVVMFQLNTPYNLADWFNSLEETSNDEYGRHLNYKGWDINDQTFEQTELNSKVNNNWRMDGEYHNSDTPERVCFYERDYYPLSNFSAFNVQTGDKKFQTLEAAYHWFKFIDHPVIQGLIERSTSAHEAFKIAQNYKSLQLPYWNKIKVSIMKQLLHKKVDQHEYVRTKLLATGDRELVEDSWRDDFWGWGPYEDGENMLGKLWMEVREEIKCQGEWRI